MSANAAYCTACRAYVFIAEDGSCEYGHPRPQLRGLYEAGVDRRTGRPKPPKTDSRATGPVHGVAATGFATTATTATPVAATPASPRHGIATRLPDEWRGPLSFAEALARLVGPPRGRHSAPRYDRNGLEVPFLIPEKARRLIARAALLIGIGGIIGVTVVVVATGDVAGLDIPAAVALAP